MMRSFVLGSGFSVEAGIPTSKQIIPRLFSNPEQSSPLWDAKNWLTNHLFATRPSWWEHTNIEEVVSRLDLFGLYSDDQNQRHTIQFIKEALLTGFIDLLQPQKYDITTSYLQFVNLLSLDDTIITFNYDLLLEEAFKHQQVAYFYPYSIQQGCQRIKVLKLHGSLNQYFCSACGYVYGFPTSWAHLAYNPLVPQKCQCPHCRHSLPEKFTQLIVAPTIFKTYSIKLLQIWWYHAFKALSKSTEIYFIGYSLPQADLLTRQLLDWAAKENIHLKKVHLINGPTSKGTDLLKIYSDLFHNTGLKFGEWISQV